MDSIQLKIEKYQQVLTSYINDLAEKANNELGNKMNYQAIIDTENNHFQFVVIGWKEDRFIYSVLLHLDIHPQTGNIWIQQNNTEIEIDLALNQLADIPKKHLVLGFRPDYVREHSEYAVA